MWARLICDISRGSFVLVIKGQCTNISRCERRIVSHSWFIKNNSSKNHINLKQKSTCRTPEMLPTEYSISANFQSSVPQSRFLKEVPQRPSCNSSQTSCAMAWTYRGRAAASINRNRGVAVEWMFMFFIAFGSFFFRFVLTLLRPPLQPKQTVN